MPPLVSAPFGIYYIILPTGDPSGHGDLESIGLAFQESNVVMLSPGSYYVNSPINIPDGSILLGSGVATVQSGVSSTIINATSTFTGTAIVTMAGQTYSEIGNLQIFANMLADGISLQGPINPYLHDLDIESPINGISSTATPTTVRARRVAVHKALDIGFTSNGTDSLWDDCLALGCSAQGWFIGNGNANSKFVSCRAEFSGTYGFQVSGSWNTGNGSGGSQFIGCSTDRNSKSGVFVSATGTTPIIFSNLSCRRDGSSSTSQYAGFEVSAATVPIIVNGLQVFPGTNDDGSGNLSPYNGVNISGSPTYVSLSDAFMHGATNGINGSAPYGLATYRNLATRTGSTSSPSAISLITDSA